MSRIPLGANVPPARATRARPTGPSTCPTSSRPPTGSPRNRGLTRADLDAFGLASQQKARVAVDEGRFKREIVAVKAPVLDAEGTPDR